MHDCQHDEVGDAASAYRTFQRAIRAMSDADDPQACLEAGRYYCLFKGEWEKGLPLLAKGSDPGLRELAETELRTPTLGGQQLELGNGWWDLSEESQSHRKAPRLRAAHW